jgi:hypothetical protein
LKKDMQKISCGVESIVAAVVVMDDTVLGVGNAMGRVALAVAGHHATFGRHRPDHLVTAVFGFRDQYQAASGNVAEIVMTGAGMVDLVASGTAYRPALKGEELTPQPRQIEQLDLTGNSGLAARSCRSWSGHRESVSA